MKIKDPHFRVYDALDAIRDGTTPSDVNTQIIMKAINNDPNIDPNLHKAYCLFDNERKRTIVDAFFITGALYDAIHRVTDIDIKILQLYHQYFIDLTVFEDRLDAHDYVQYISRFIDPQNAAILQTAMLNGPTQLQWLYGRNMKERPKYTPLIVLENMMLENMHKARAARHLPLTSPGTKVGLECSKQAIQAAINLQRLNPMDDQDALADLKLALTHEDKSINAETEGAPDPDEILH